MSSSPGSVPRIVMFGTGDFALPTFERLCDAGLPVVALVTQPDRPQGRKQELIPSRIKQAALARKLPVFQPEQVNAPESLAHIAGFEPELFVTAAYGQILSAELLGIPRLGGLNLHGSVLPAYRGASPVARAIQHGDPESGVTVIQMTPQIDAGGMIAVARTPIDPDETAGELEDRLAVLGAPLIEQCIHDLIAGRVTILPQDRSQVTRAPKLRKEDGRIDWSAPALSVHDLVRAMLPWPSASTHWHPGGQRPPVRLILHKTRVVPGTGEPGRALATEPGRLVVAAGQQAVEILQLQIPGKRIMAAPEFLHGYRVQPGDRFEG